jgi:hypothetical protein
MSKAVAIRHLFVGSVILLALALNNAHAQHSSVLSYHGSPSRQGNFVVPNLTWDRARSVRLDSNFRAQISGHVYAQPLYWRASNAQSGVLIVATESNLVEAIDARSGNGMWQRPLGKPAARSSLPCGNISPLGVTGTPVIDEATQAVYLDAMVEGAAGPRHLVFALSLKDGAVLPGWPLDVQVALTKGGHHFVAREQNQRGALTILDGTLYVPFGGHFGDCGGYRGVVVGISLSQPQAVKTWMTRARGGGIWAPGGISSDGQSLFVATGNTFGASSWSDGEAVIRLPSSLNRSNSKRDYFAPVDWHALDERDADLGGTNPIPLDVPTSNGKQAIVLAFGKDRKAYLLDRNQLGGIGGALVTEQVATRAILTAPAAYPAEDGAFVVLHGEGARCRAPGNGVIALKVQPGNPPAIRTAWCASAQGAGSPIATTTDGHSNPIVWILGAEGDNRLHAFKGDSGEPLFTSESLAGLRHFQTLIATEDRLYVAADGRVYAFAF